MLSLFQREFRFKGIVFTNTPSLIAFAKRHKVNTISKYPVNRFHMPLIREMFLLSHATYSASYYGYINSDILLSPNIFQAVSFTAYNSRLGLLKPYVLFFCWVFCSMRLPVEFTKYPSMMHWI